MLIYSIAHGHLYVSYTIYLLAFMIVLLAVYKPYKETKRHLTDIIMFGVTIVFYTGVILYFEYPYMMLEQPYHTADSVFYGLLLCLLPLYGLALLACQVGIFTTKVVFSKISSFLRRNGEMDSPVSELFLAREESSSLLC